MLEATAAMNRVVSQCAQAPVSAPSARAQGPTMQMLTEKLAIFKTINKSLKNNKKSCQFSSNGKRTTSEPTRVKLLRAHIEKAT